MRSYICQGTRFHIFWCALQYHKNPRACSSALNIEDPYTNRIILLRFINVICATSLLLYIAGRIRVAFWFFANCKKNFANKTQDTSTKKHMSFFLSRLILNTLDSGITMNLNTIVSKQSCLTEPYS